MNWIITIFVLAWVLVGCGKQPGCRIVTVTIVNGCTSPASYSYPVKDQRYCMAELVQIRKQNGTYREYQAGNVVCRITTLVSER